MVFLYKILPWVLPPLLGAAIGYITNAIAISMLFRPYEIKKIFGIKLPLTPGIIPKERFELSVNIGRLVSKELLTEDAVSKQISSSGFRETAGDNIARLVDKAVSTPVGSLNRLFSSAEMELRDDGSSEVQMLIISLINRFLSSENAGWISRSFLSSVIGYFARKTPSDMFSGNPEKVRKGIDFILGPGIRSRLSMFIRSEIEKGIHDNRRLYEIIDSDTAESLGKAGVRLYELLFPEIIKWLNEPVTKMELEIRGRFLLEDIFHKLNRVQRFLLSAAQYDKTLEENMGSIIDELIETFEKEGAGADIKEKLLKVITSRLKKISQLSLGEIVAAWEGDFWEDYGKAEIFLFDIIFSDTSREFLFRRIASFLEEKKTVPIGELVSSVFNVEKDFLTESLPDILLPKSVNLRELVSGILSVSSRNHEDLTLTDILKLDGNSVSEIASVFTTVFIETLKNKIPEILQSVDVQTLVVQKIDSLDIVKIEELILEIVKKQLRWINLFGALLGSIIGAVQLLLNLSMR